MTGAARRDATIPGWMHQTRHASRARGIPASSRCSQPASGPPPTRSAEVHDPALGSNRDKRFARTRFDMPAPRFLDTAEKQDTKLISAPRRRTAAIPLRKGLARYLGGVFPRSRGTGYIARFVAEHRECRSREITPRCRMNVSRRQTRVRKKKSGFLSKNTFHSTLPCSATNR